MKHNNHNKHALGWFMEVKNAFIKGKKLPITPLDAKKYIILFAYNIIDIQIQFLIAEKYLVNGCDNPLFEEFREMIYPKFQIREKTKTLKHYDLTNTLSKIIQSINEVRNGVAHRYALKHKKFKYPDENGKNIFDNDEIFRLFIDDAEEVFDWLYTKFVDLLEIRHKDYKQSMIEGEMTGAQEYINALGDII